MSIEKPYAKGMFKVGDDLRNGGLGNAELLSLRIPTKPPGYNGIMPPGIPE
jgi:hypothetical protein